MGWVWGFLLLFGLDCFGFLVVAWFGLVWFFLTVSLFSSGRLGTNDPPTSALRVVGTLDALHHGRLEMYLSQV